MVTDSFLSFACAGIIVMLFGLAMTFAGYRLFLYLLPIWGFFFGLMFGAQTIQALLGSSFLGDVTSWIVGFLAGAVFAVLSYRILLPCSGDHCRLSRICPGCILSHLDRSTVRLRGLADWPRRRSHCSRCRDPV